MSLYNFKFRSIADVAATDLEVFRCAEEDLQRFLVEDALSFDADSITTTTVVYLEGRDGIAAFFSLSADALRLSKGEAFHLGLNYEVPTSFFPAVKITKLAVASGLEGNGMGKELIKSIMGLVYGLSRAAAVRLITVDALNKPNVVAFYEKNGFSRCAQDARMNREQRHKRTLPMYKDIYASDND